MTTFYAVQETRDDAWDYGPPNFEIALHMLEAQGKGLIAVIDEDTGLCIYEINFDEI